MRKIIEGRKYDTDAAKMVVGVSHGRYSERHSVRKLYQKRTGEFFFYDVEYYADSDAEKSTKITPATFDEAKDYVAKHAPSETYDELFGEIAENEDEPKNEPITLSLPPALIRKLKNTAVECRASASELVAKYIETL